MDWLLRFDLESFKAIHIGLHAPWLDYVFLVITYTGLSQIQIAATLLLLVRKSTRLYVLPLLVAILASGLLGAQLFKHIFDRERPSNLALSHPQEHWYGNSFPSGHTTTAFACAFLLLFMTWGTSRIKWGWLALVWAGLVGVSRIYRGVHWPTDALEGTFLGLVSACVVWLVFRYLENKA